MPRVLLYIIFIPLVLTVLVGVHRYIWARLVRDTGLPPRWRRVGTVAVSLLAVSQPLVFALSRALPPDTARVVLFLPYIWMGMMLYVVLICLGGDLLRLGRWVLERRARQRAGEAPMEPGRRFFLARAVASTSVITSAGVAAAAQRTALHKLVVRKLEVALPNLPPALAGMTVVQLSDLHIGPMLGRAWLEGVVRRTLELKPDLVAITGDLVDGSVERLRDDIAPLERLRAPMGVYFVTGNHEYYSGAEPWLARVRQMGIRTLRNERVSVGRAGHTFDLAGVDDFNAGRMLPDHGPDLTAALKGRDPGRALLLLAHQPRAVYEAASAGVGLVLSGHTHGGQLWPWKYMVYLQQPYISGLHRHGPTQIYVNQGTGFWGPPMRVATRCEITEITLKAG